MSFVQAKPIATHNFYNQIHKGLRLRLSQLLAQSGSCSGDDPEALAGLLRDLRFQIHVSEHHLANEDAFIHTALEARAPGSTARLARDHEQHRQTFEALETAICAVEAAKPAARAAALKALYLRYSTFVADDFAHMAEEELLILPVLQSLFSDEELIGIEGRIMSALSPEMMMGFGGFIVRAGTRAERIRLLTAVRAKAPPQAFAGMMAGAVRPNLEPADYAHLCAGLGIAA
ncbi:hemerythrin domain-containing protein [Phenylobacterium sp.]|uniref:hemerythrin domain-containing protein n=1 Tax=Phenylobacterium sp. TaxID=1871053 RepID=UPI0035616756